MKPTIYSLDIERMVLGGLFKFNELIFELPPILEKHFVAKTHKVIYSLIKQTVDSKESIDHVLIAQKFTNLGVSVPDEIGSIFNYLEDLKEIRNTKESVIESAIQLESLLVRREIQDLGIQIREKAEKSVNNDPEEILGEIAKVYNDKMAGFSNSIGGPISIFDVMEQEIEAAALNPELSVQRIDTPFRTFNDLFGGPVLGELFVFVARAGHGKSTFLVNLSWRMANQGDIKYPVLYLDTEMNTNVVMQRMAASISQVPLGDIEDGSWSKSPEMAKKIRAAFKTIKGYKFDHKFIRNKPIEEVINMIKRWYYSEVGAGNPGIVVYDYIKLGGEQTSAHSPEHQIIGDKTDKLKSVAEELGIAVLTSAQLNRSGEKGRGKWSDIADDQSAISASDRIAWFAANIYIFRQKTVEDIEQDGPENGTHKLIPIKTRYQGKKSRGHLDFVKRECVEDAGDYNTKRKGAYGEDSEKKKSFKYERNYISYKVENFDVEEIGDLRFILERNKIKDLEIEKEVRAKIDEDLF